jgi:hypothetical protein
MMEMGISLKRSQALMVASVSLPSRCGCFFQELLGVALHEGELEGPPGRAHDGHPDELLLEKELQERDLPVEDLLEDQDVDPGLVVGYDQVPALGVEPFDAGDIPGDLFREGHDEIVASDPVQPEFVEEGAELLLCLFRGHEELYPCHGEQERCAENRIQDEKDEGKGSQGNLGHEQEKASHKRDYFFRKWFRPHAFLLIRKSSRQSSNSPDMYSTGCRDVL